MQTILGSGGSIGVELAGILPEYTDEVRLVSRNPRKVNESDQLVSADLTNSSETMHAVEASTVVYLTVGLPYSYNVWKENWPVVMRNAIAACKVHRSKLVFFDNIYMYSADHLDGMDENTPIDPPSKKGTVRAEIAKLLLEEAEKGDLRALIARSADFYGPGIVQNGVLREMLFKPLAEGKKANWMSALDKKHSATYTPDAARATAILGNTDSAYGQVWHLPTASEPPTGQEWANMIADALGTKPKVRAAPKWMMKVLGWFDPVMAELPEMMYQYDRDYVFNSDKFEKEFDFTPTSYAEGIRRIAREDYGVAY